MVSFLSSYLTDYDETLSGDSYIDPIGTLIIWSAFGRQVFNDRVNSVSNDVRNYTLNLFHHHLVRRLASDDTVQFGASLRQQYKNKDALAFKQACLILLENLFVFSMLRHERTQGVETGGVLGISKARRRWAQTGEQTRLVFTHGSEGQVLARQLGLGVSGRYKTPLMKIGFFDTAYQYHIPRYLARWAEAESFILNPGNSVLAKLEREAYRFLKNHIPVLRHKGEISFDDVPSSLTKAYAMAFSSPPAVGAYARDFWLKQTGLDKGAAGAIYKVLQDEQYQDSDLSSRKVIEQAIKLAAQLEEKAKLEQIARVEPFLSDCSLLFSLMTTARDHSVGAVAATWHTRFNRSNGHLPELAKRASDVAHIPVLMGTEAGRRFIALQKVAQAGDTEEQVRALAKYHGQVMQSRGQPTWLSIHDGAKIKVHARTAAAPRPEQRPPGAWYNDYYLLQFRRLVKGMQGIDA
jgi:hypothetical protein